METYENEIRRLISRIGEVDIAKVTDDADLANDLHLDSLQALELMTALEKKFDVNIPEEEITRFKNVRGIAELVTELQVKVA